MKKLLGILLALAFVALSLIAGDQVTSGWGQIYDMGGNPKGDYFATTDGMVFYPDEGASSHWLWNGETYDKYGGVEWMECECVAYDTQWHCIAWHWKIWEQVAPPGWPPYFLGEGYVY